MTPIASAKDETGTGLAGSPKKRADSSFAEQSYATAGHPFRYTGSLVEYRLFVGTGRTA
jgi:hypothetical protein